MPFVPPRSEAKPCRRHDSDPDHFRSDTGRTCVSESNRHPGPCVERSVCAGRGGLHDDLQRGPGAEPRPWRVPHARRVRVLHLGAGARHPQGRRICPGTAARAPRFAMLTYTVLVRRLQNNPIAGGDLDPDPRRGHPGPDRHRVRPSAQEHVAGRAGRPALRGSLRHLQHPAGNGDELGGAGRPAAVRAPNAPGPGHPGGVDGSQGRPHLGDRSPSDEPRDVGDLRGTVRTGRRVLRDLHAAPPGHVGWLRSSLPWRW